MAADASPSAHIRAERAFSRPKGAGLLTVIHGTAVSHGGRALLITGASGSGKSSLALNMMALGAGLISDDQAELYGDGDQLWVRAPANGLPLIEARTFGLLTASPVAPAPVAAAITLDQTETDRLPQPRTKTFLQFTVPFFHKPASDALPAMLMQYLNHGLLDSDDPTATQLAKAASP